MNKIVFLLIVLIILSCVTTKVLSNELGSDITTNNDDKVDSLSSYRKINEPLQDSYLSQTTRKRKKSKNRKIKAIYDSTAQINDLIFLNSDKENINEDIETGNKEKEEKEEERSFIKWQVFFKCGTHRNERLANQARDWLYKQKEKFHRGDLNLKRRYENGGYIIIINEFSDLIEAKIYEHKISRIKNKLPVYLARRQVKVNNPVKMATQLKSELQRLKIQI